jgi:hypothetical protein
VRLDQCRRLLGWPEPLAGFVLVGFMAAGNIKLNLLIRVREAIDASTPMISTASAARQIGFNMKEFLEVIDSEYATQLRGARVIFKWQKIL